MTIKNIIFTLIFIFLLTACTKENNHKNMQYNMDDIKNVLQAKWDKLAGKKIFFGHQSVGYNIMDGLEILLNENPSIKLKIEEGNSLSLFDQPVLAHAKNGQNTDPISKIDAFYKTMESGLGDKVDMAGFKFCYVDFNSSTDVNKVFQYYKLKMNEISLKYPNVKIIHFTVPLMSIQSGPKAFVKKVLGKDIGIKDNYARQQFNTLLVDGFGEQAIFGLAKYESTYPDGQREFILDNNKQIYAMIPAYTDDGGHLSKTGKYNIGMQFLLFLEEESNAR